LLKFQHSKMKQQLLLLLLFTTLSYANINDTIYYNSKWIRVEKKQEAKFLKAIEFTSIDSTTTVSKMFFTSGKLYSEQQFADYKKRVKNGSFKRWYENGQLEFECYYIENKLNGTVSSYWENGNAKRIDNYIEGKLIDGKCFDRSGNEIKHFDFITIPEFPGGMQASAKFIMKNYKMPNPEKDIKGKILAYFEIDIEGNLQNIQIIQSLEPSFDLEYLRILAKMPKWSPCKIENEPTHFEFIFPLSLDVRAE